MARTEPYLAKPDVLPREFSTERVATNNSDSNMTPSITSSLDIQFFSLLKLTDNIIFSKILTLFIFLVRNSAKIMKFVPQKLVNEPEM